PADHARLHRLVPHRVHLDGLRVAALPRPQVGRRPAAGDRQPGSRRRRRPGPGSPRTVAEVAGPEKAASGRPRSGARPATDQDLTSDLIDTHAHLDDEQFQADLPAVLKRAAAAGVRRVVTIATTAPSSVRCVELAGQHEMLAATVGIQPNHVDEAAPGAWG